MIPDIKQAFAEAEATLYGFSRNPENIKTISEIAKAIAKSYLQRGKVIIFGNGGSMCDAMHFAEELTGRFHLDRPALPAIAISDPSHITCVANDYGFEHIFSRGVQAYAASQDVVIGLSTSGNSENIINGLQAAKNLNCTTVALLGGTGGKLAGSADFELIVKADRSDRVQEIHTSILHILVQLTEARLFFSDPNTQHFS